MSKTWKDNNRYSTEDVRQLRSEKGVGNSRRVKVKAKAKAKWSFVPQVKRTEKPRGMVHLMNYI